MNIHVILINVTLDSNSIWIGIPKPHLRLPPGGSKAVKHVIIIVQLLSYIIGGEGGDGLGSGHTQKSIQSPDGLNKNPTDYTKPQNIRQRPKTLYKTLETRKTNK